MVLDPEAPAVLGVPDDHLLDALVFSSPEAEPRQVYVAGRAVERVDVAGPFADAMRALWA